MAAVIKIYHWLTDVNFLEFWTFNVEFEFLSLFLHGFKTGESRHVLNVANLALKGMPWVAIYCKEHDMSVRVRIKHVDEMKRVVECLQGEHGLGAKKKSAWALTTPTNSEGFVVGKVWAIARIGLTSPVKKIAEARLESLSLTEAKQEYSDVAGKHAVTTLCTSHATYNKGQGATTKHFNTAPMEFLEQNGLMRAQEKKLFDHATNCELPLESKGVCRLKPTCTPLGAARNYVTTITDVHILNYAVSLETCRITTNTQGV